MVQDMLKPSSSRVKSSYSNDVVSAQLSSLLATLDQNPTLQTLTVRPNSTSTFTVTSSNVSYTSSSPNLIITRYEPSGTSSGAVIRGRTARGTETVPLGSSTGDTSLYFDGNAFTSDTLAFVRIGTIRINATEPITSTTRGCEIIFATTVAGTTSTITSAVMRGGDLTLAHSGFGGNLIFADGKVRIGNGAGVTNQGVSAIAIGTSAGSVNQNPSTIAIGVSAGFTGQGDFGIAIGSSAGQTSQGNYSIAIGASAGQTGQGSYAIAIGASSGVTGQGAKSISINSSGSTFTSTGINSICINSSTMANAITSTFNRTIAINASASAIIPTSVDALYIKPIRGVAHGAGVGTLRYDPSTGEITYSTT